MATLWSWPSAPLSRTDKAGKVQDWLPNLQGLVQNENVKKFSLFQNYWRLKTNKRKTPKTVTTKLMKPGHCPLLRNSSLAPVGSKGSWCSGPLAVSSGWGRGEDAWFEGRTNFLHPLPTAEILSLQLNQFRWRLDPFGRGSRLQLLSVTLFMLDGKVEGESTRQFWVCRDA